MAGLSNTVSDMVSTALSIINKEKENLTANYENDSSSDDLDPESLYRNTMDIFRRQQSENTKRKRPRGRPSDRVEVYLYCLNKARDNLPTAKKQKTLKQIGLGCQKDKSATYLKRSMSLSDLQNHIYLQFPGVPLELVGFTFGRATKRKVIIKVEFSNMSQLKKEVGRGRLYIMPKRKLTPDMIATPVGSTELVEESLENAAFNSDVENNDDENHICTEERPRTSQNAAFNSDVENNDDENHICTEERPGTSQDAAFNSDVENNDDENHICTEERPGTSQDAAFNSDVENNDDENHICTEERPGTSQDESLPDIRIRRRFRGRTKLGGRRKPRAASQLARHQIRKWCNRNTPLIEISEDELENNSMTDLGNKNTVASLQSRSAITRNLINNSGLTTEALRSQQDLEYAESLRKDQDKEQKRKEEEERRRHVDERLVEEQKKATDLEQLRIERKGRLPEEPSDGFKLKFKTQTSWIDVTRKFKASSEMSVLQDFIGSLEGATQKFQIYLAHRSPPISSTKRCGKLADVGIIHPTVIRIQWLDEDNSDIEFYDPEIAENVTLPLDRDFPVVPFISDEEFMDEVTSVYEDVEAEDIHQLSTVNPSVDSDCLSKALKMKAQDLVSTAEDDYLRIVVRRSSVLKDSLQNIRRAQQKLLKPISVRFIGESAVDDGGPTRELASELTHCFKDSFFTEGNDNEKMFIKDFTLFDSKQYLYLGQLIAVLLLQGGQGLPVFSHSVAHYIVTGNVTDRDYDLPEKIKDSIKELGQKKGPDIVSSLDTLFPNRFEEGFTLPSFKMTADQLPLLKRTMVAHYVIGHQQMALDQFLEGLKVADVLSIVRQYQDEGYKLFKGADANLTAMLLESIVKFQYCGIDVGSNLMPPAQAMEMGWINVLQAAECKEAVFTFGDGNRYEITLSKVLQWMTGASRIPAIGLPSNIYVTFDSSSLLPKMNTCALQVSVPVRMDFLDPDTFMKQMAEWIINSEGYGLV